MKQLSTLRDRCPVCDMKVGDDAPSRVWRGIPLRFCSAQCRERFEASPGLYLGAPGQSAPRQCGERLMKQRRFRLDTAPNAEQARQLQDAIAAMMGVVHVDIDGAELRVDYDLLQATAEQIEQRVVEAGGRLGQDWRARMQRALLHFGEDWEVGGREPSATGHDHHH